MDPEAQGGFDTRGVMMLDMDPPKHTRYRLLVNKGFTPRMIGLLEQYLRTARTLIVDDVIEHGECDFVVDIAAELPLQAIAEIIGVPQEDRHKLFEWSNRMIGADDPEFEGDANGGDARRSSCSCTPTTSPSSAAADPRDDIVTTLLNAEIDGEQLSELEFDMFFLLLAVAGNETTRNAISHGMCGAHAAPRPVRRSCSDDPDTRASTARSRRSCAGRRRSCTSAAPPPPTPRSAASEIKEGDKVVIWYISANRDEDVFDDPFRFDITRDPNEHVAFGGGGPHFCLGANLARMELQLIFEEMLDAHPRHAARRRARACCARTSSAASSTCR